MILSCIILKLCSWSLFAFFVKQEAKFNLLNEAWAFFVGVYKAFACFMCSNVKIHWPLLAHWLTSLLVLSCAIIIIIQRPNRQCVLRCSVSMYHPIFFIRARQDFFFSWLFPLLICTKLLRFFLCSFSFVQSFYSTTTNNHLNAHQEGKIQYTHEQTN